MNAQLDFKVNPENKWRTETDGPYPSWEYEVRPNAKKKKYYIITTDTHLTMPSFVFTERLSAKWHDHLPMMESRNGRRYLTMKGLKPELIIDAPLVDEDLMRQKRGNNVMRYTGNEALVDESRINDLKFDGMDGEVIFPNGQALFNWASNIPELVDELCGIYNDWAMESCKPFINFSNPAAMLPTIDIDRSIKEVERVAKLGYRIAMLPCTPTFATSNMDSPNYNWPDYDRLWAALQDHDLTVTYHVATGKDPRGVKKTGGTMINYVVHALTPAVEPTVSMCAAGILERFPKLRVATIEANAGWVPWMLQLMDEAYKKHHFWIPQNERMKQLPSEYYRSNCFCSFGEDKAAMDLVERHRLEDNFMFANDYPHHEGLWPHSPEAIERTLGTELKETTRKKILGLNAAKCFRFDVPKDYQENYL